MRNLFIEPSVTALTKVDQGDMMQPIPISGILWTYETDGAIVSPVISAEGAAIIKCHHKALNPILCRYTTALIVTLRLCRRDA